MSRESAFNGVSRYIEQQMQTPNWETLRWLNRKVANVEFLPVPRDLEEPKAARSIRLRTWEARLQERMAVLSKVNPDKEYTISQDDRDPNATGQLALYENIEPTKKRVMWAGTTLTLAQSGVYNEGDKVIIPVYPINYSEWIACYNQDYAEAYRNAGLPIPYAGVGVSVLMITREGSNQDSRNHGLIPLTRRGLETPVYPAMLYSPGGGPKPSESSVESILNEIVEETGLKAGIHFNPDNLFALAMVSDRRFAGSDHSRPELVAYLPLDVTYGEVEQIQYEQAVRKGLREQDVWGIVPYSAFIPNIEKAILYDGPQMCPPTEAGLAHLLLNQELRQNGLNDALGKIEKTMERLRLYRRLAYRPQIERLQQM